MDAIWILFAMPVLALSYTVYVVAKSERTRVPAPVTQMPSTPFYSAEKRGCYQLKRRGIKWISRKECEFLLRNSDDVIVINLISQPSTGARGFPETHELYVSLSQLPELLRWVPSESSVVLQGTFDVWDSVFSTAHNIPGLAPVYVLTEPEMHSEIVRGAA